MTSLFHGRAQRAFNAPSSMKAAGYSSRWKSCVLGPRSGAHSPSVPREHAVVGSIALLLSLCRPSTIVRRISAIVVDAINRVSVWARPHVCQEVFVRMPAFTERNATPAILMKPRALGVAASREQARPHDVFRRPVLSDSCAMRDGCHSTLAPTTVVVAASKMAAFHFDCLPADAPTCPVTIGRTANNDKASERLTSKIAHLLSVLRWASALLTIRSRGGCFGRACTALGGFASLSSKRDGMRVFAQRPQQQIAIRRCDQTVLNSHSGCPAKPFYRGHAGSITHSAVGLYYQMRAEP